MAKDSSVLDVLDGFFKVLEPNEKAQSVRVQKRAIKFLEKNLKKSIKRWKKDGLSDIELRRIEELEEALHQKKLKLGI